MLQIRQNLAAALCCAAAVTVAPAGADDFSGQLRGLWSVSASNPDSPSIAAAGWLPGMRASGSNDAVAEGEFRWRGGPLNAVFTVQGQRDTAGHSAATAWLNELVWNHDLGAWQFSAGKKIVAWDVGYGFRPNDVVQQGQRRQLISSNFIGHPLAMVEYFDELNAASLVWVNPVSHSDAPDREQALAARLYHRAGSLDLHGYARYGERSGASIGAAAAWVAGESWELHASARTLRDGGPDSPDGALQALAGATYTTVEQHSWLFEAWWDGSAASTSAWRDWSARNRSLLGALALPGPARQGVAGALAGQSRALSASASLQRLNLYARWSWQSGPWEPALDILYTPADAGRIVTAALGWQGDRWRLDAGLRVYGGAGGAVLAQLPDARRAYVAATWAF